MGRLVLLVILAACTDRATAPVYHDIHDELQARINDVNRTLVRCWQVPTCRQTTLITWTSWDSTHAPAFILRRTP